MPKYQHATNTEIPNRIVKTPPIEDLKVLLPFIVNIKGLPNISMELNNSIYFIPGNIIKYNLL